MLRSMALPDEPSENGYFQCENFSLGHISAEVFCNPSQTHFLLLDGWINNTTQVKQMLLEAGQVVPSDKMEDLIILAYQTWSTDCFKHFNGPFVIVIFDKNYQKMIIARDRLGSRTLYWSRIRKTFIFASKLKGILSASIVPQLPDLNSISSYFVLGYFSQDRTPVQNINRLLPGYYIEINENQDILINKYWSFKNLSFDTSNFSEAEVTHNIEKLVIDALKKRELLSPESGILNNGDIGSACLAKYLKQIHPGAKNSYTIEFQDQFDEKKEYAKRYADKFGYNHIQHTLKPEDMLLEIQQLVWHLDEPIADPHSMGIWSLAKSLKDRYKCIYSSLGSHEFLGSHMGQTTLSYEPLFLWFLYLSKPLFLKGVIPLVGKVNKKLSLNGLRFFQRDFWSVEYVRQQALFSERSLKKIAPKLKGLFDINLFLQQSYEHLKFILYQNFKIEDYLFFDAETTLSNRLLIQYESLFEYHGIRFYSPFLDSDVMDYLIQIPEPFKSRGKKGGLPLYNLLQPELKEDEIFNFEQRTPWFLLHWFQNPQLKELFSLLSNGVLAESNIIDGKNLKKVFEKKVWKYRQFERMWSILVLEIWFNLFINNPIYNYPKVESVQDFFTAQRLIIKNNV